VYRRDANDAAELRELMRSGVLRGPRFVERSTPSNPDEAMTCFRLDGALCEMVTLHRR
jgi:hypothetical protein